MNWSNFGSGLVELQTVVPEWLRKSVVRYVVLQFFQYCYCNFFNFLALLVFYVPSESGEKVTLGISALLSMTVFLMTIRESLPPTEKTPLISEFIT